MHSPIEQLPSQSLLNRCAEGWGLRDFTFVRKMENIVYACETDNGKVFLRLTTPLRRTRAEIEAELNWIGHLARCGLNVPRLLPDRDGNRILSLTEGSQHYEAVVFSEIVGVHPSKEIAFDPKFLKTLGALIGKMHLASQCYEAAHQGGKREEWYEERGLRHALTAAASSNQAALRKRLEDAVSWMKQLDRILENYGLVHADLGTLNLFIGDDSTISVIDFDDSCYHWFAFDLAIVIFSMAGRFGHTAKSQEEEVWLSHLLEGYRTVLPIKEKEISLIPKFVDFACLRLFFWIEHHEKLNTFHKDALEKVSKQKQWLTSRL